MKSPSDLVAWLLGSSDATSTALVFGAEAVSYGELREQLRSKVTRGDAAIRLAAKPDLDTVVRLLSAWRADLCCVLSSDGSSSADPGSHDCLVLFSSGSTGKPRGVRLTAESIAANTEALIDAHGVTKFEVAYLPMPLHYAFGLSVLLTHLRAGATTVVASHPFAQDHANHMRREGVTSLYGPPALMRGLLDRSSVAREPLGSLRKIVIAGDAPSKQLLHELREVFAGARIDLRWGATELSSGATSATFGEPGVSARTLGRAIRGVSVRILSEAGETLPDGEVGEIAVSGPTVAAGYTNEEVGGFVDGEFRTGDRGFIDERGLLQMVARNENIIKVNGRRVAPQRVESVICELEAVSTCVACGTPDPVAGGRVAAMVVLRRGASATPESILAHCRERLASFEVPARIVFTGELPLTLHGKIDRREVAAILSHQS